MSLHVVVVADARHPVGEPFAGGMQSLTWHLVHGLRRHGVEVTVFAGPGSDPSLDARVLDVGELTLSEAARADVSMPPETFLAQHHAYLELMLSLARRTDIDLVHNNSLHHLPVAMSAALPVPLLTTLHTPPTPWLESALALAPRARHGLVAVSAHTSRAWTPVVGSPPPVVPNGIDVARWPLGPGGTDLVWTGRLAPEKAPHLALDMARAANRRIRLAGPVVDPAYFRAEVAPRLGHDAEHVGHLGHHALADLVGASAACLVTPAWDEPYGLVAAEALACGTPVLALDRGGLREVVGADCARLVPGTDVSSAEEVVASAAALVDEVAGLDRRAAREHAQRHCSLDTMLTSYLSIYADLAERRAA